jgi:predicted house-cleaning NTP pyrophosphatase (Maf/HAM1 superfamily)
MRGSRQEMHKALARHKAECVAHYLPDDLIIAADTIVVLGNDHPQQTG